MTFPLETPFEQMKSALLVIVLDDQIRNWMLRHDPKAFEQVVKAVDTYLTPEHHLLITKDRAQVEQERDNYCSYCDIIIEGPADHRDGCYQVTTNELREGGLL